MKTKAPLSVPSRTDHPFFAVALLRYFCGLYNSELTIYGI